MTLLEFSERFPTKKSCRLHFKSVRDKQGVSCRKCAHKEHYWLQYKEQYEFKKCKFRTALRSGTAIENSNMPFKKWYIAMVELLAINLANVKHIQEKQYVFKINHLNKSKQ